MIKPPDECTVPFRYYNCLPSKILHTNLHTVSNNQANSPHNPWPTRLYCSIYELQTMLNLRQSTQNLFPQNHFLNFVKSKFCTFTFIVLETLVNFQTTSCLLIYIIYIYGCLILGSIFY